MRLLSAPLGAPGESPRFSDRVVAALLRRSLLEDTTLELTVCGSPSVGQRRAICTLTLLLFSDRGAPVIDRLSHCAAASLDSASPDTTAPSLLRLTPLSRSIPRPGPYCAAAAAASCLFGCLAPPPAQPPSGHLMRPGRRALLLQRAADPSVILSSPVWMIDGTGETELREEYITMVSQIFDSEEQGYEHYNKYAKEKGFNVRLD
ncbi:uncharacterized protein LOC124697833 [Lolium rigidum]|uniref:uncharacterized protein LOC124697833 n=1 Tax=Lolium rigidum TaxID=89674 RepID=UPI001F5CE737|nr:uncharacterized protein LOC124697833 [Lolium rigidum]